MKILILLFLSLTARADSFDLVKDGKNYHCEQVDNGAGTCWDKCPYGFTTCKDQCGGGDKCWDKCPYGFTTCKDYCGATKACWDKCPYGFTTCKDYCGGGDGCWTKCPYGFTTCKDYCGPQADPMAIFRFNASRADRVKAEAERLLLTK